MTCFGCICGVARVARKKFHILLISGVLHLIWTYFIYVRILTLKIHLGYDSINPPKYTYNGRCLSLLDRHDLLVPLSQATIPLLPYIVRMPLLKLILILITQKKIHRSTCTSLCNSYRARNAMCRLVSDSK